MPVKYKRPLLLHRRPCLKDCLIFALIATPFLLIGMHSRTGLVFESVFLFFAACLIAFSIGCVLYLVAVLMGRALHALSSSFGSTPD